MVRKPSIARKLHRNMCNFIFFAFFGGKHGLTSMQQAYVHGWTSMQHTYVRRLIVQQGTYIIQKVVFLEGNLNSMIGKGCKWMGQCLGCIDVAFLDYNRCPLMCEVRRETDGRNTLQHLYTVGRHRVE
jgi:hypothetical protein